jgi:ferredoxin
MPYVVTENCTGCRFTDCVTVCPVACFHGDDNRCVPMCPVRAISEDLDLTDDRLKWTDINAEKALALPVVRVKQAPLPGAEARRDTIVGTA